MRISNFLASLLLLSLTGLIAHAAEEPTITVKLHRDDRVGDVVEEHTVVQRSQTATQIPPAGGATRRVTTDKWDLTGTQEYLEVLPIGACRRSLLTVKKLVGASGAELVPGGTQIEITRNENEIALKVIGTAALSDTAKAALQRLFPPVHPETPNDDLSMGTDNPHKSGDSWDVRSEVIAQVLKLHGQSADASDITGKVTLKSLDIVNAAPVMRIAADIHLTNLKLAGGLPPWNVDSCTVHNQFDGVLPVDPSLQPLEMGAHAETLIHCSMPSGEKLIIEDDLSRHSTFTWLKRGK